MVGGSAFYYVTSTIGGSERQAVDEKLVMGKSNLPNRAPRRRCQRRRCGKIRASIFRGSREVNDLAILASNADKAAIDFRGKGFIDLASEPIGALTRQLWKQLVRNRLALRRQRSFQGRIEIVLQSKVNRCSEEEERSGQQARVPGRHAEAKRARVHAWSPASML